MIGTANILQALEASHICGKEPSLAVLGRLGLFFPFVEKLLNGVVFCVGTKLGCFVVSPVLGMGSDSYRRNRLS